MANGDEMHTKPKSPLASCAKRVYHKKGKIFSAVWRFFDRSLFNRRAYGCIAHFERRKNVGAK